MPVVLSVRVASELGFPGLQVGVETNGLLLNVPSLNNLNKIEIQWIGVSSWEIILVQYNTKFWKGVVKISKN